MSEQNAFQPYQDKDLLDLVYHYKRLREQSEWRFYLARKGYEGDHFVMWDKNAGQITNMPNVNKAYMNQIPEVSKQVDAYTNFLLSTSYTFTLIPTSLSDENAVKDAMYLSLLAHDYWKQLKEKTTYQNFVHYALLDNVSFIEVTPNDSNTDVEYKQFDAFDILFNPKIKDWSKQRLVIKVVKKNKNDLAASKLYNINGIKLTSGSSMFSWKDIYEQEKYSSFVNLDKDEILLFECHIIERDGSLRIKTIDGAKNVIRDDKYPNIKTNGFVPLQIFPGEYYQPSYAYRQLPINRSADLLNSRMESIFLKLAKGGLLVQEEERIDSSMNEETGQIIKYAAVKPDQLQMPQIPSFLPEWFNTMLSLSERYGVNSILSGGMPMQASNIRATGMLDRITGQAMRNSTSTIDNLMSANKRILELTFQFLYEMWQTPQDALYTDMASQMPRFISAKWRTSSTDDKVISIPSQFKRFSVEVDDGLGYTLESRKETAMALNKLGILSGNTLKKLFKLGSSGYLLEGDETPMYKTEDFQKLLKAFPSMDSEQKQAVINMLQTVGEQVGEKPETVQELPNVMAGQVPPVGGQNVG